MSKSSESGRAAHEEQLIRQGIYARPPSSLTPVMAATGWLDMLTVSQFNELPDGTEVISVFSGAIRIKGTDYIDLDTRAGLIAFGLPVSEERAAWLTRHYGYGFS